jgi:hypothetical protein
MKLGQEFDIDILANAVLEWPQLSGPAALGTTVQSTILMTK